MVANVWNSLPIIIILTIAALQTISPELIEAAKVDGAGRGKMSLLIMLVSAVTSCLTIGPTVISWSKSLMNYMG